MVILNFAGMLRSIWPREFKNFFKIKPYLYITLGVYTILVVMLALRHESWADEAQAWLIAKECTVPDLLLHVIRYEGTPALWHLILMVPAKLGLPYKYISLFSASISIISIYFFLRFSPFNPILKVLLPFTYFIFFQYSVVARSYVLLPLLLFILASFYERWQEKIFIFVTLTSLLANVSIHATLLSIFIFLYCYTDIVRKWVLLSETHKRSYILGAIIYIFILCLILIQVYPPADVSFAPGTRFNIPLFLVESVYRMSDSLFSNYTLEHNWSLGYGLSFALFFYFILLWLLRKGVLVLYLLPIVSILVLFHVKYYNVWHQGILFIYLIFVLWISFIKKSRFRQDETSNVNNIAEHKERWWRKIINISIAIISIIQIYWSVNTFLFDFNTSYSGSRQTALFLQSNNLTNLKIAAFGFKCTAIQPYFTENIYTNINIDSKKSYWVWSVNNYNRPVLFNNPDVIIESIPAMYSDGSLTLDGYKAIQRFNGNLYWKTGCLEDEDFIIYIRE
ncbi:MAG: hypothetical protein H6Q73_1591 [Firmicutes bacterium]|nr:hypothetical protein [Bacillota bacterium]